jgi:hypothetical protein
MNERIRELAEQAGMTLKPRRLWDDNEPNGYLESDDDYFQHNLEAVREFFDGGLEKFAELIIEECVSLCMAVENDDELSDYVGGFRDGALLCQSEIKERFGVTE